MNSQQIYKNAIDRPLSLLVIATLISFISLFISPFAILNIGYFNLYLSIYDFGYISLLFTISWICCLISTIYFYYISQISLSKDGLVKIRAQNENNYLYLKILILISLIFGISGLFLFIQDYVNVNNDSMRLNLGPGVYGFIFSLLLIFISGKSVFKFRSISFTKR